MSAVGKLDAICAVHEAFEKLLYTLQRKAGCEGKEFFMLLGFSAATIAKQTGREDMWERIKQLMSIPGELSQVQKTEVEVMLLELFLDASPHTLEEKELWKETLANVRATLDAWKEAEKSADTTIN